MMERRKHLARQGLTEALRLRQQYHIKLNEALCPYDLAEKLGIKVYFDNSMPSMEAAYINSKPSKIIVTSLRPIGRMAYSCAHEIGHHVFGHGSHIDEVKEQTQKTKKSSEEFLAEVFAGFLLMPKLAVNYGFSQRKWSCHDCTPKQVFIIAGWLGVGYTTLVTHMCHTLKLITTTKAKELCKVLPGRIKKELVGKQFQKNVFWIDRLWVGRPIDVCVGDLIITGKTLEFEGHIAEPIPLRLAEHAFLALHPGIGRLQTHDGSWSMFVRVSRKEYKGWGRYRHLEDPEHE